MVIIHHKKWPKSTIGTTETSRKGDKMLFLNGRFTCVDSFHR